MTRIKLEGGFRRIFLGLGEAWKKSEVLAERRKRKEEMQNEAEERFTAQKRAEFLSLVRNGCIHF